MIIARGRQVKTDSFALATDSLISILQILPLTNLSVVNQDTKNQQDRDGIIVKYYFDYNLLDLGIFFNSVSQKVPVISKLFSSQQKEYQDQILIYSR